MALVESDYLADLFRVESGTFHVCDLVLRVNRHPNEQPRSDLTWRQAPLLPDRDGYQMIRNPHRIHTSEPWSLAWPEIKIWRAGGAPTEIFLGEGYGSPIIQSGVWQAVGNPEPFQSPMAPAQRDGPGTTFAAVSELFERAPESTRVEEIPAEAGISALRIRRSDRVDISVTRRDNKGIEEAVVDPLKKMAVSIGGSSILIQIHGEVVQHWADARETSADAQPQHDTTARVPAGGRVTAQHQCMNTIQREGLR